jgi:heat shock 70kDa protein 4
VFALVERDASVSHSRQITSNLKNTITGPKAIIGKKFHSDDVQKEIPLVAYSMIDVAGEVGVPVRTSWLAAARARVLVC